MKLSKEQIEAIQQDCDARAQRELARAVEATLLQNRKRISQRKGKPLPKHSDESLKEIA